LGPPPFFLSIPARVPDLIMALPTCRSSQMSLLSHGSRHSPLKKSFVFDGLDCISERMRLRFGFQPAGWVSPSVNGPMGSPILFNPKSFRVPTASGSKVTQGGVPTGNQPPRQPRSPHLQPMFGGFPPPTASFFNPRRSPSFPRLRPTRNATFLI